MDETVYTEDYIEGTRALHEGRLAEALAAFRQVPEESACWVMAQGNLGLALLRMDSYQEAERQLRRVLAEMERRECPHPPAQVQFMRNLGEALVKQGRRVESIRVFGEACRVADILVAKHSSLVAQIECEKAHALNSCGTACLILGQADQAVTALNQARDIYRRHPSDDRTGHAETLTNLAVAQCEIGQPTTAEFALQEAIDIVHETGDYDQLFRIRVVAGKMGSKLVKADGLLELVQAGAEDALATGRPGTAYLRYCKAVMFVVQNGGDPEAARRMIRCARELEGQLDPRDPHAPKLRYLEALVLRLAGEPLSRITSVLIEGAHQWYRRIAVPLIPADFHYEATDLHMHFRLLAACLVDLNRVEEALVAFDAGRGLSYAVEVDPAFFARVIAQNPFAEDGSTVDLAQLQQAQRNLDSGHVAVVLAVVPPRMIAFLIAPDRVDCVARLVAAAQKDLDTLDSDVKMLPSRLAQGVGPRAVPDSILAFTRDVVAAVGTRTLSRFIPYDSLHLVPWRTLLHHCGLP